MKGLVADLLLGPTKTYDAEIDETGGTFSRSGMTVILIKTDERNAMKSAIRQKLSLSGNYTEREPTARTGSVDPLEFKLNDATTNYYRLVFKPKNKKTGAGTRVTDLGEAFQCYILAARQERDTDMTRVSDISMMREVVLRNTDCPKIPIDDALKNTPEGWINSGEVLANKMFKDSLFGTNATYEFHHQSQLVTNIYKCFKGAINISEPGLRMGSDKWNPADIWAVKKDKKQFLITKFQASNFPLGISQLNGYILELFDAKTLIPISLKKFDTGTPKGSKLNHGVDFTPGTFTHTGWKNHTKDKFNTVDVLLQFTRTNSKNTAAGVIQFRSFGGGHQGNVTRLGGSTTAAVHGKVGVYENFLLKALRLENLHAEFIPKSHEPELNRIQKDTKNLVKVGQYDRMGIAYRIKTFLDLATIDEAEKLMNDYTGAKFHASFLGIQLVYYFNKLSLSGKTELLTKFATYAMSQVPGISCVHSKYE